MPELPEMENYKIQLNHLIKNKKISQVTIQREKSVNINPKLFESKLKGQTIKKIQRHAKFLVFQLEDGHYLLLHLMLGGWLFYGKEADKPDHTAQVEMTFESQAPSEVHHLYFMGLRLGYLHFISPKELDEKLKSLGPNPIDSKFSFEEFERLAKQKRGGLKSALVDQHFVSGIGNRYSDEICWEAELLPDRTISDLKKEQLEMVYQSMRKVLLKAVGKHGYMEHPLTKEDFLTGQFLKNMKVHRREGEPCERCGAPIIMEKIASKKTCFCRQCQH